jgi:uncharacterized protein YbdZ (MbtH family)
MMSCATQRSDQQRRVVFRILHNQQSQVIAHSILPEKFPVPDGSSDIFQNNLLNQSSVNS